MPSYDHGIEQDAARYRWLRNRDLDSIVEGGVFAGKVPDNLVINGKDLDMEIDAAMLKVPNEQVQETPKAVACNVGLGNEREREYER